MPSLSTVVNEYHLPLIKLFAVNNNYLPLIKIFTLVEFFSVDNNSLLLTELIKVNSYCLPLIKIFTVNNNN